MGTKCWKKAGSVTADTWLDAVEGCKAEGAILASVTSAEEQTQVRVSGQSYSHVGQFQLEAMMSSDGAWIGLSDVLQEGTFAWRDGSELTYTNWKTNNPNNANGEQHCVWARGDDGTWDDIVCRRTEEYICQKTARS